MKNYIFTVRCENVRVMFYFTTRIDKTKHKYFRLFSFLDR